MPALDSGFELYIEDGPDRGRFITLSQQTIKMGRRSRHTRISAWITLDDPTMSEHHATLVWDSDGEQYRLLHRSKTNPTLVNGRAVHSTILRHNDIIQMGRVVLRIIRRKPVGSDGSQGSDAGRPAPRSRRRRMRWRAISAQDRIMLFHNVGMMLQCGIPLVRAMEAIVEQTENPWLADTLVAIGSDLRGGSSLSGALQAHSPPFQPFEVGLVRAGESSGTLSEVLLNLAESRLKDLELVRQVKGSLTYPATVLVAGMALVVFLGRYSFKALMPLLLSTGTPLPWATQVLVWLTRLGDNPIAIITGVPLAMLLAVWLVRYAATPQGILAVDSLLLKVPLVGNLVSQVAAARFCYSLTLLYRSGVPMIRALQEASQSCGNAQVAQRARASYQLLSQGHTLAESLCACGVFPWFMLSMVDVGETTGKLDDMLFRVARIIDMQVRDSLERVVKALEPLTILLMGVLVGFILIAAFLPIYGVIARL